MSKINHDYGHHYYDSSDTKCLLHDKKCIEEATSKDQLGLIFGLTCLIIVFLIIGCIVWRSLRNKGMRTKFKGKWEFLNSSDMKHREVRKLVKNMKRVNNSFHNNDDQFGAKFDANFDTVSASDDSADYAYGREDDDKVSDNSERDEAMALMAMLSIPPPVEGM